MTHHEIPQSTRVTRRSLLLASAGLLALPSLARSAPIEPVAATVIIPDNPAGRQLTWVLEQVNHSANGLTVREIRQHVDPGFLIGLPADQLRGLLRSYVGPNGPLTPTRFEGGIRDTRIHLIAVNADREMWRIRLGVAEDEPYLINALYFEPVSTPLVSARSPDTWPEIIDALARLAPRVSFAAAELTGSGPHWLSRLHGNQQRAIASSFKLYVLGELLRHVEDREIDWQEQLPIQDALRSLPNGDMRYLPAGFESPVQHYAERMIAGSDNTATDHLIGLLGRAPVQTGMSELGHSSPTSNLPLLMTREWFAMRMRLRDAQIERYLAADTGTRLRILAHTVDPLADQLSDAEPWPGPRYIDQVEWFAGAADLVRAMEWLRRHSDGAGGMPARDALSLNPGVCWHPDTWRYVGYKGGYETGVMSNSWLLERQDGRWFAVSAIINDTRREIDAAGLWSLLATSERLLAATP